MKKSDVCTEEDARGIPVIWLMLQELSRIIEIDSLCLWRYLQRIKNKEDPNKYDVRFLYFYNIFVRYIILECYAY